ncbi:hypothetical protein I7I53_10637 [Histoplasma capsulatum var. duboisii H88]|uniref:Uncharacterized protein n=1 Tax=Ajellomyces capsulatus (strain H88) TaxID=544711 RepID=A0A8A1L7Y1_AJEC8|nr:hypothetical protein I7I53_10637 [Histoplasma capsulatum var. duboisii H88]
MSVSFLCALPSQYPHIIQYLPRGCLSGRWFVSVSNGAVPYSVTFASSVYSEQGIRQKKALTPTFDILSCHLPYVQYGISRLL